MRTICKFPNEKHFIVWSLNFLYIWATYLKVKVFLWNFFAFMELCNVSFSLVWKFYVPSSGWRETKCMKDGNRLEMWMKIEPMLMNNSNVGRKRSTVKIILKHHSDKNGVIKEVEKDVCSKSSFLSLRKSLFNESTKGRKKKLYKTWYWTRFMLLWLKNWISSDCFLPTPLTPCYEHYSQ